MKHFLLAILFSAKASAAPLLPIASKDLEAKRSGSRATIVNMWATWCEPCKQEMPELLEYRKKNAARGVQLLLVDADQPEDRKEAEKFLTQIGVDFPAYHLAEEPDKFMKPLVENWSATIPTTLVYDAKGKRVGYWIGRIKMKELEATVEKALK